MSLNDLCTRPASDIPRVSEVQPGGLGFGIYGFGFGVWGLGLGVEGFGLGVLGLRLPAFSPATVEYVFVKQIFTDMQQRMYHDLSFKPTHEPVRVWR